LFTDDHLHRRACLGLSASVLPGPTAGHRTNRNGVRFYERLRHFGGISPARPLRIHTQEGVGTVEVKSFFKII